MPNFLPAPMRSRLPAPFSNSAVSLGLDLQGGAHLLLAVDRLTLADHAGRNLTETARTVVTDQGGDPRSVRRTGDIITLPATDQVSTSLQARATDGLGATDTPHFTIDQDGDTLRLSIPEAALERIAADAAGRSIEVIRHRIDQVSVSEPQISRVGRDRILVQLPGLEYPAQLRALIGTTAQMSFHLVAPDTGTAQPGASRH